MRKFYISLMFFSVFFILIACEEKEDETSDVLDELNEPSEFEKEVKEIIINELGPVDEDGNDRIEDIMVKDGSEAEKMIDEIEKDSTQENLDIDTKAMLRESMIDVTINLTQDESGRTYNSAIILHKLYEKYDLDEVTIVWNISDVPGEDAQALYVLKKQTEARLNWDEIFEDSLFINPSFVSDIDLYIDWP